jgi:hypothetical protein
MRAQSATQALEQKCFIVQDQDASGHRALHPPGSRLRVQPNRVNVGSPVAGLFETRAGYAAFT